METGRETSTSAPAVKKHADAGRGRRVNSNRNQQSGTVGSTEQSRGYISDGTKWKAGKADVWR